MTNAILGGTPAYRREFAQGDTPAGPDDFDAWLVRTVLNPARPLFREARYLLAEEHDLRDTALYHSVFAAIAEGNATRGGIASYLARPSTDLAHPLGVLEDVGLISREPDLFRGNRSAYRIGEPLVAFYHAVMRPVWGELERPGRAARVLHEIDVGVLGQSEADRSEVLCLGEAKWNTVMTPGHLERLARVRDLLRDHPGPTASDRTRLALFSGAGFSDEARELAARSDNVVLVDLHRLYYGE